MKLPPEVKNKHTSLRLLFGTRESGETSTSLQDGHWWFSVSSKVVRIPEKQDKKKCKEGITCNSIYLWHYQLQQKLWSAEVFRSITWCTWLHDDVWEIFACVKCLRCKMVQCLGKIEMNTGWEILTFKDTVNKWLKLVYKLLHAWWLISYCSFSVNTIDWHI